MPWSDWLEMLKAHKRANTGSEELLQHSSSGDFLITVSLAIFAQPL
jgi:hypothetical protein